MLKRISICFFSLSMLMISVSSAQNIITTIDTVINVACNHAALGSATVTVVNVSHTPYTFQWSNGQNVTGQITSTATNLEVGTYTVTITDSQDGDLARLEINIIENECVMYPEAVFTPNGDGYNDTWFIDKATFFPDMQVLVYNRLGQKIYEHYGVYTAWEGRDMFGASLPAASYYYIIYPNKSDRGVVMKGCVSIIR